MKKEYYIICKRHMNRNDFAVLFWGKNSSGYRYNVEDAGIYDEEYIKRFDGHHSDDMPVEVDLVKGILETYVIDRTSLGKIVPNTTKNRKALGVKIGELLTGNTAWDSGAFIKPNVFLMYNKNTEELLNKIRSSGVVECTPSTK